jgi:hypothetical protein
MSHKFLAMLVTLLLSWNAMAASEETDVQVTHGGDAYTAEFLKIYGDLRQIIFEPVIPLSTGIEISVSNLDSVRTKLKIESLPVLFRNDQEVSAINTPASFLIQISQKHWNQINYQQKELLILHELLPVLGFIDDEYKHSAAWAQYLELRKGDFSDPKKIGRSILQCDRHWLNSITQSRYDSFTADSQAEYLMLAAFGTCSGYFELAIRFSSQQVVKSSCEAGSQATPLSSFFKFLGKNALNYETNFEGATATQATFNLLYAGPQDRMQKCDFASGSTSPYDVCQVIAENEPGFNPALQSFARQIGCP